ncbi:outer membrane protein OmpU [Rhodovulum imhoffii]|uniref:Outer membrane protein OmpU n=1 Tax=Rhodovulum imhoffii TaxID=365340 RepID=A0A2T5BV06_9RHOB|nr:porin [Rhodovulum imhoffii]MBK5934916.1 hypothetical protein [Rhodovulum imhoffii]PTN03317.1 outer membrane protein OmpU [Rhodovulum imhoffii]
MKKVLFATTALVATAGYAAADITISGSAEMGVVGGERYDYVTEYQDDTLGTVREKVSNDDIQFHNDFTIAVDGTGETDGGLTFGFHVELEESNSPARINGDSSYDNETVFISGAFGTLTLGETDGAYDKRLKEVALAGGSIADDETEHAGFNGNAGLDPYGDEQNLRYDYDFGNFGISASLAQTDDGRKGSDEIWGVGVSYDANLASGMTIGFGLGYQTTDDADVYGVSIYGDFGNGFEAALNYSSLDIDDTGDDDDADHIGIGVAYTMDALTLAANYGKYDFNGDNEAEGFGLIANYDLGGGAVVQFGYGNSDVDFDDADIDVDADSYSLGIAMSF